jgi:hypothetical protein
MIRLGKLDDIDVIIEMLTHYRAASPFDFHKTTTDETAREILELVFNYGRGFVLLAEKDNKTVGMLIAIKNINIWNKNVMCLNELAYWLEPEYRGGTLGYRLIKKYQEIGDMMKSNGEITYYTISKMSTSPDLSYNKLGFEKIEETWNR